MACWCRQYQRLPTDNFTFPPWRRGRGKGQRSAQCAAVSPPESRPPALRYLTMTYSFTEKKRIRKEFGKRPAVLDVPPLLDIQVHSYREFLQEGTSPNSREDKGLHAALKSVF